MKPFLVRVKWMAQIEAIGWVEADNELEAERLTELLDHDEFADWEFTHEPVEVVEVEEISDDEEEADDTETMDHVSEDHGSTLD